MQVDLLGVRSSSRHLLVSKNLLRNHFSHIWLFFYLQRQKVLIIYKVSLNWDKKFLSIFEEFAEYTVEDKDNERDKEIVEIAFKR